MSKEDTREKEYALLGGIGDMEPFEAPPRTKQNVKPSRNETSTNSITEDDLRGLREAQAEIKRLKEQLETMKQSQEDVEVLKSMIVKLKYGTEDTTVNYTPSVTENMYQTPQRRPNDRHVMERGSPVTGNIFKQNPSYYKKTGLYEYNGEPKWGVPKNKYMKLPLAKFSAKETYKGLGTGINEWVNRFIRQLVRAQIASGMCWSECIKIDVLEDHLEGKALE